MKVDFSKGFQKICTLKSDIKNILESSDFLESTVPSEDFRKLKFVVWLTPECCLLCQWCPPHPGDIIFNFTRQYISAIG
jgi:hypothetical protein